MGPFAEDFRAAFGLGIDETSIGHIDVAGVTLAATQALDRRTAEHQQTTAALEAKTAEIERLRNVVEALRAANATTEQRLLQLERSLAHGQPLLGRVRQ